MRILITGGAGYIGSHTASQFLDKGHDVIIADNMSRGHRGAVLGGKLFVGDLRSSDFLDSIFSSNKIDAVVHFAADSQVGESMKDPFKYYNNNFGGSLSLLTAMQKHGVDKIVFSSTAATYGEPKSIPIVETDETLPTNPYGETKLSVEKCLKWADAVHNIRYVALRYFNASGAHPTKDIGEDHSPETHLIPLVLKTALGQRESISVFGNDYNTKDGTCVRDYIHVMDLANAHLLAIEKLAEGMPSNIFNLGNGEGFSVMEVIEKSRVITGKEIPSVISPRREGDPETLIASSKKAQEVLGWKPEYADLDTIIETAWKWHKNHPDGYKD